MQLLEMDASGGDTSAQASVIDRITSQVLQVPNAAHPDDFVPAVKETLGQMDYPELLAVQTRIGSYDPASLRAFGHALYSYTRREHEHHPKPSANIAISFYAETTPTAVTFLRTGSDEAIYSVLSSTLSNEYALLVRAVDAGTAMSLGRAAVMCRSINGGLPLALGGSFNKKFVSPYSGTITFEDLGWLGRQEAKLAPHADYLREHKTYERHFIEKLLATAPTVGP